METTANKAYAIMLPEWQKDLDYQWSCISVNRYRSWKTGKRAARRIPRPLGAIIKMDDNYRLTMNHLYDFKLIVCNPFCWN